MPSRHLVVPLQPYRIKGGMQKNGRGNGWKLCSDSNIPRTMSSPQRCDVLHTATIISSDRNLDIHNCKHNTSYQRLARIHPSRSTDTGCQRRVIVSASHGVTRSHHWMSPLTKHSHSAEIAINVMFATAGMRHALQCQMEGWSTM